MGSDVKRIRNAARAADAAAAARAFLIPEATGATAAVFAGDVTCVSGEVLSTYRTPNGSLLAYGNQGTALAFEPGELAALREILDRCAMPGQAA